MTTFTLCSERGSGRHAGKADDAYQPSFFGKRLHCRPKSWIVRAASRASGLEDEGMTKKERIVPEGSRVYDRASTWLTESCMGGRSVVLALLLLCAVAFVLRAVGFEDVFIGRGEVIFSFGDPYYMLRRGLYSMVAFPAVLQRDAYVNFPADVGAVLPPLYTWLLGGLGRLLGGDVRSFEHAAAWLGPVVGTLTLLPTYGASRVLGGPRTALAAAALVALLPVSVLSGRVGDADYHAFMTLLGAVWLCSLLAALRPVVGARSLAAAYVGVTLARTAVLTAWPGSLAYLGPAEGALFLGEVLLGSPGRLLGHTASLLASTAVVVPVIVASGEPVAGSLSTLSLSWIHVIAMLTLAGVAAACALLERLRPARSVAARSLRAALLVLVGAALVLSQSAAREGLLAAVGFLGGSDSWVRHNAELLPLFRSDDQGRWLPPVTYGVFGYAIPLLPLVPLALARDPARRAPALALAAWTAPLGGLTMLHMRYGSEFLVAYGVCVALALAGLSHRLASRLGDAPARGLVAGLIALSLVPAVLVIHAPALAQSLAALSEPPGGDRALTLPVGSLVRFSEEVRRVTPETSGFLDPDARPEYGILVEPKIGHTLLYVARRPTPAGNFGRFVGPENYDATKRFYAAPDEETAVAIADALRTPFVVTTEFGSSGKGAKRVLHDGDGRAPDGARWTRFRLVTEGPAGGRALGELFGVPQRPGMPPYKLFERVQGAVLEVLAPAGTPAAAQTLVKTPTGRRFVFRVAGVADPDGIARLRVPYATETSAPARPVTPFHVEVGGEDGGLARVTDEDVRRGNPVRVTRTPVGASGHSPAAATVESQPSATRARAAP